MAGDEGGAVDADARTRLPSTRITARLTAIKRRLGVLGQGQILDRAVPHQLAELLLQGVVDFLEHRASGREGDGELGAHADGLAALAGKEKSEAHARWLPTLWISSANG